MWHCAHLPSRTLLNLTVGPSVPSVLRHPVR